MGRVDRFLEDTCCSTSGEDINVDLDSRYESLNKLLEYVFGKLYIRYPKRSCLVLNRNYCVQVPTSTLSDVEQWNEMVLAIMLGAAGLVQYVMDSYPEDIREFWLE